MTSNKPSINPEATVFFNLANGYYNDMDPFKDNPINARNEEGETPLHMAVRNGKPKLVDAYIEAGADIYLRNNEGQYVLHSAAMGGNASVVECLTKAGLSIDVQDEQGETPLFTAIRYEQNQLLSTLSADFDIENINVRNVNGESPFFVAVQAGNIEAMNILIENKADVNMKDNRGRTPMDYIVQSIDMTRRLLETSHARMDDAEDLNAQLDHLMQVKYTLWTNGGKQSEHLASELTSEMANEYSERRKIAMENELIEAIVSDNQEAVLQLIESGVDLNAKREGGFPLSKEREMAFMEDFQPMGCTPTRYPDLLHVAVEHSNPEIVKMMIEAGAHSIETNEYGQTILHIASMNGNAEMMQVLVQSGLDPNVLNEQGETPLDVFDKGNISILPNLADREEKIDLLQSSGFKRSNEPEDQNRNASMLSCSSENITYGTDSSIEKIQILQKDRSDN